MINNSYGFDNLRIRVDGVLPGPFPKIGPSEPQDITTHLSLIRRASTITINCYLHGITWVMVSVISWVIGTYLLPCFTRVLLRVARLKKCGFMECTSVKLTTDTFYLYKIQKKIKKYLMKKVLRYIVHYWAKLNGAAQHNLLHSNGLNTGVFRT